MPGSRPIPFPLPDTNEDWRRFFVGWMAGAAREFCDTIGGEGWRLEIETDIAGIYLESFVVATPSGRLEVSIDQLENFTPEQEAEASDRLLGTFIRSRRRAYLTRAVADGLISAEQSEGMFNLWGEMDKMRREGT